MRIAGGLGLGMPETRAEEWRLGNAAGEGENQGGRRWWRVEIGGQVEGGGGEGECRKSGRWGRIGMDDGGKRLGRGWS